MTLKVHQFGNRTLYRRVSTANHTSLLQVVTTVVTTHLYGSLHTLTYVYNHLAVLGALAQSIQQPRLLGRITTAEGAHHDGFKVGRVDDMTDKILANAWEERENDDVVVEAEMGCHRLREVGLQDAVVMVGDVDTGIDEVWKVEGLEGIKFLGALFCRAVAA